MTPSVRTRLIRNLEALFAACLLSGMTHNAPPIYAGSVLPHPGRVPPHSQLRNQLRKLQGLNRAADDERLKRSILRANEIGTSPEVTLPTKKAADLMKRYPTAAMLSRKPSRDPRMVIDRKAVLDRYRMPRVLEKSK